MFLLLHCSPRVLCSVHIDSLFSLGECAPQASWYQVHFECGDVLLGNHFIIICSSLEQASSELGLGAQRDPVKNSIQPSLCYQQLSQDNDIYQSTRSLLLVHFLIFIYVYCIKFGKDITASSGIFILIFATEIQAEKEAQKIVQQARQCTIALSVELIKFYRPYIESERYPFTSRKGSKSLQSSERGGFQTVQIRG